MVKFCLPSSYLDKKNISFEVETSTGGRVPGNSRARISFGSGYKGSSPGDIRGRMAPPQGGDKSQDKKPGKGALSCTRMLGLSIYHETRCKLEICNPGTKPWDYGRNLSSLAFGLFYSSLQGQLLH